MKHLITSTALAVILATPAWAQDQQQSADQAFLQSLQSGDILVGELVGQDVYASSQDMEAVAETEGTGDEAMETGEIEENGAEADAEVTDLEADGDAQAEAEDTQTENGQEVAQDQQQQTGEMLTIGSDQLEGMETLGQVSEVVIDHQGEARGILLQVNDREVAVDMRHISFAFDQDDPDQVYVIAEISQEELEQAPDFQRDRMAEARDQETEETAAAEDEADTAQETAVVEEDAEAADETAATEQEAQPDQETAEAQQEGETTEETGAIPDDADEQWRGDREAFGQPDVQREGMQRAEANQVSMDNLIGATVYDVEDNSIGDVDDVIAGENGELEFVVIDVGGFLGIGTHTVALGLDEITVLHDEGWSDVQVYVDATQEQLENLPEYAQN